MAFRPTFVLLLTLSLLLLLSGVQGAFQYAPILSSMTKSEGTGSYSAAEAVCGEHGAYLATEPTASLHESHAALGGSSGGSTWYAFLGGDATTPQGYAVTCSFSVIVIGAGNSGYLYNCFYRWNTGRWRDFTDDAATVGASNVIYRGGIAFYKGSLFDYTYDSTLNEGWGCNTGLCYVVNSFPNYFPAVTTGSLDTSMYKARPGVNRGLYVILVGSGSSATWSDNEPSGGYVYSDLSFPNGYRGLPSFGSYASSATSFIAMCDVQAPSRIMLEPYRDPNSNSNLLWWVIFLVILLVVCGVVFGIVLCCQEREDMEEPPEDAPEWAQREASSVQNTDRYVSQKNFSSTDGDRYEDNTSQSSFRSGSSRSSVASADTTSNGSESSA